LSLQSLINEDLKKAMLSKEEPKLSTLRLLKSDIQYELTKTGASTISDEVVINLIKSNQKKRKEAASEYTKAGRNDLAEKELAEEKILLMYLPATMPEAEIKLVVEKIILEMGAKGPSDTGKVMGRVMQELKGKNAEGSVVSNLVKSILSQN
jgi:hypothetical protein